MAKGACPLELLNVSSMFSNPLYFPEINQFPDCRNISQEFLPEVLSRQLNIKKIYASNTHVDGYGNII